ncbi:hypothetical protein [Microlunatus antarcticus]|uniref:Uncharacterized protein n=1 Tax=Microlunatus antarcticus TaxID=53388 RepID=A0A7W5JSZ7_9ACTN|nr:hypothetical protein [Microlunatus antarcticus]MBB3325814.1 hypothetical protein [Microlunatus antarcticus]
MTTEQDPRQLFAPPPADGGLFVGGSILDSRTGVAAAAEQWAGGAGNLDLDDLSVELLQVAQQRPGAPDENAAGRRASALMLARRFGEALAALPPDLVLPPPGDDDLRRDHLVAATCRAALGDDGAMAWLRQVAPLVSATDWAGYLAHCLLRVGDARGDLGLSEAALGQLQRLGDKGRRVLPRIVADVVGRRPRAKPEGPAGRTKIWGAPRDNPTSTAVRESAGVLRVATDLLHSASESFVSDPQLVLDTAELLRMRGDRDGAALLLHVVDRTNPHVARIQAALAAYVPPGAKGRRRLRRVLLLVLGAIAFLVSGVTGYPTIALFAGIGIGLVEIFAREPGLNRFDTGVASEYAEKIGIRAFFLAPRSVADEVPLGGTRKVLPIVLGVLALVLGILVFPPARDVAAAHGQPAGWITSPALGTFLVWIVLFPALVTWAASLVPDRRLGYVVPRLTAAQSECQCRRWTWVAGPFAFAYSTAHLVPVETPAALRPVLDRYGPLPPSVVSCTTTGAAWLVLTLGPENGKILLRSPLGTLPDPVEPPEGLPTGQYL